MSNTTDAQIALSQKLASDHKPASGSKNGYELRVEILALAKSLLENEYGAKLHANPLPETAKNLVFPTVDDILAAAEKMYSFVNSRR